MQMPAYMVPSEIRIVDAIERNLNGKHDRAALAQALAEAYEPARESGAAS